MGDDNVIKCDYNLDGAAGERRYDGTARTECPPERWAARGSYDLSGCCDTPYLGPDTGYLNIFTYNDDDGNCQLNMSELATVCTGEKFKDCINFIESSDLLVPKSGDIDNELADADGDGNCFISPNELEQTENQFARDWLAIQLSQNNNMYGNVPYSLGQGFSLIGGEGSGCCITGIADGGLEVKDTSEDICGLDTTVVDGGHWAGATAATTTPVEDFTGWSDRGPKQPVHVTGSDGGARGQIQCFVRRLEERLQTTNTWYSTYRLYISHTGSTANKLYNLYSLHTKDEADDDGWNVPAAFQVLDPLGANTGGVSDAVIAVNNESKFDSWITLGAAWTAQGVLSSVGLGWDNWNADGPLTYTFGEGAGGGAVFAMDSVNHGARFYLDDGNAVDDILVAQITIPSEQALNVAMRAEGKIDVNSNASWEAKLKWSVDEDPRGQTATTPGGQSLTPTLTPTR